MNFREMLMTGHPSKFYNISKIDLDPGKILEALHSLSAFLVLYLKSLVLWLLNTGLVAGRVG